jgi:hypothetical protein
MFWLLGGVIVTRQLIARNPGGAASHLIEWLILWTAEAALVSYHLMWDIFITQYLRLDSTGLTRWRSICGITFGLKSFRFANIKNLRVWQSVGVIEFGSRGKKFRVAFDFGIKIVTLLKNLGEAEAQYICWQLGSLLPSLIEPSLY